MSSQLGDSGAAFGTVKGSVAVGGGRREIDGVGRIGLSTTGLGPVSFNWRRLLWACFRDGAGHHALELRVTRGHDGEQRSGRALAGSQWTPCAIERLEVDTPPVDHPPQRLEAQIVTTGGTRAIAGRAMNFVSLSRPGPAGSRIYTSLGFATFSFDNREGAGMFESSRRVQPVADQPGGTGDSEEED